MRSAHDCPGRGSQHAGVGSEPVQASASGSLG
jgi:hypothetical protein